MVGGLITNQEVAMKGALTVIQAFEYGKDSRATGAKFWHNLKRNWLLLCEKQRPDCWPESWRQYSGCLDKIPKNNV
jgi:hypothetical protein